MAAPRKYPDELRERAQGRPKHRRLLRRGRELELHNDRGHRRNRKTRQRQSQTTMLYPAGRAIPPGL